jgi:SOS-response transcriptional repressor LexA
MPKKNFIPNKLKPWIEARSRYRLSNAQIQMARQLGMNPKKFGGLANHTQEPWKEPLPQFIESLYQKKFGKVLPANTPSIEAKEKQKRSKKEAKMQTQRTDF